MGGKERLKHGVLQEYEVALKDKDVTNWLASQDAYTLHRTAPVKYKRNRVVVYWKYVQFQADLVDMSAHLKENDNIQFLLTCIDVFSKYAWARPLKNKTGKEVTKAFDDSKKTACRKNYRLIKAPKYSIILLQRVTSKDL